MPSGRYFTDEERAELRANPYTAAVYEKKISFTVAFKKYVVEQYNKPGMTHAKIFESAGYRKELFPRSTMEGLIHRFLKEAESPEGFKEPKIPKKTSSNTQKQLKAALDRIEILEQEMAFLKKSQFLKEHPDIQYPFNTD